MNMRNFWSTGAAALAMMAAATPVLAQQSTGDIRGSVLDQSGNPVAGAEISIVHVPSGTRTQLNSNNSGAFVASGLRVGGPYEIEVSAPNYERISAQDLFVSLGDVFRVNFQLVEETPVEEVVVVGDRAGSASGFSVGNRVNQDRVEGVASVNRDLRDIVRRNPLATLNVAGDRGISIAGSIPRSNRITIDGVRAQDDFGLNTGGLPTVRGPISLDAIEQVSVNVAEFDPEQGDFTGGSIAVTHKSGTNKIEGSGFWQTNREFLDGDTVDGRPVNNRFRGRDFGGFIGAPLIKDRLFIAGSYESFEQTSAVAGGPAATAPGDIVFSNPSTLSATAFNAIGQSLQTLYGFAPLGVPATTPITDRKWSARLDWNITDNHKAQFTYRASRGSQAANVNGGGLSFGDSSTFYIQGERENTFAGQINSNWTSNFSTELRITRRNYLREQNPFGDINNAEGTPEADAEEFAEVRVCSSATSGFSATSCQLVGSNVTAPQVTFGPDQFRQANQLRTGNTSYHFKGQYLLGNHTIKAGYQRQGKEIDNLFVPQSDGVFYFDSVADFQAGRANQLIYQNTLTGNPDADGRALFEYAINSWFVNDTWDVASWLTLSLGLRYDRYASNDEPTFNRAFANRFAASGLTNTEFLDGRDVFSPRFGFKAKLPFEIDARGGIGKFASTVSDVFLSNAFSNDGARFNTITITRSGAAGAANEFSITPATTGFTQALGAQALTLTRNGQGQFDLFNIPPAIQALLASGGAPLGAPTYSFDPNFEIPAEWKANLNLTRTFDLPFVENIRAGFDLVFGVTGQGYTFRDLRASADGTLPDGRPRYIGDNALTPGFDRAISRAITNTDGNTDIQATNTQSGNSRVWAVSLGKSWDFGLDINVSYARQEVNTVIDGTRFGSTPNGVFTGTAARDLNNPELGTSSEEVKNALKYEFNFERHFFKDLKTRLTIFGERRSGRPFSYVFADNTPTQTARSTVFGITGANAAGANNNGGRALFYVPDFANDTNPNDLQTGFVFFDTAATRDAVRNFVLNGSLAAFQGQIAPRNAFRNPAVNRIDLKFAQEIPWFFGHKPEAFIEIDNFLNFLNSNWGVVREFATNTRVVDVLCADAAGVVAANTTSAQNNLCTNYRYQSVNFQTNPLTTDLDTFGVNPNQSRWTAQIGLRYKF